MITHRKMDKVDKWARKTYPDRYPKTPDQTHLIKESDNGAEKTDEVKA